MPIASPMLKLDFFSLKSENSLLFSMESRTFFFCSFLLLSRRKAILFPWKVDDLLPKWKGNVALFSCIMNCSSF